MKYYYLLLFNLLLLSSTFAETSVLKRKLFEDIRDGELNRFSFIEAAFILSDVDKPDSLEFYTDWFYNLTTTIKAFQFDDFDRVTSAEKLFNYLRNTQYGEYQLEATTLLDIINRGKYNCVSGTILYNLVCEELGWHSEAFETPTHVYTIFNDFNKKVIVENTHPMGFNIMQNLQVYTQYLASFYPDNDVYKIGLDRLYAHENQNGRVINNTELLGLLAYNQAYFSMQHKKYERAYELVLVAQDFNRDSRSNVRFERNLYYKWGKQCFDERRYYDAFEVFADATYRYPDDKHFAKNCKTAFFNTLSYNWSKKKWGRTRRVVEEISELEILDRNEQERVKSLLQSWKKYLTTKDRKKALAELNRIL